MTVKELKALLETLPEDMLVILLRGRQSEHAAVLHEAKQMLYVPHSDQHGFAFGLQDPGPFGPQAEVGLVLRPAR